MTTFDEALGELVSMGFNSSELGEGEVSANQDAELLVASLLGLFDLEGVNGLVISLVWILTNIEG